MAEVEREWHIPCRGHKTHSVFLILSGEFKRNSLSSRYIHIHSRNQNYTAVTNLTPSTSDVRARKRQNHFKRPDQEAPTDRRNTPFFQKHTPSFILLGLMPSRTPSNVHVPCRLLRWKPFSLPDSNSSRTPHHFRQVSFRTLRVTNFIYNI